MSAEQVVEQIIEEFDRYVLMSAAWDCMPEHSKDKFKQKLATLLESELA